MNEKMPEWVWNTAKAFNSLWRERRKEIEGAVAAWTAWERRHLHDDDKPAMPEAARLGYVCAVMIGTVNKVVADAPDSVSMPAGMESTPVPDGLAGVCLAVVAPDEWPASEREILEAWELVAKAFGENKQSKANDAPRISAAELEALREQAASNPREAGERLFAMFPDLTTLEIHAGTMHLRGKTWDGIQKQCQCARGTAGKAIERFYKVTGFARPDRKGGFNGKICRVDEKRDAAKVASEDEMN